MNIRYKNSLDGISWKRISEIFEAVGWGRRNLKELKLSFEKSSYVRIAYDKEKIVGFGRTVDDGQYYALIVDVLIDPEYQRKGVGATILKDIEDDLEEYRFTTLTAAPGKDRFYQKQGWKKQNSAYIWPRSKKQEELYSTSSEQIS